MTLTLKEIVEGLEARRSVVRSWQSLVTVLQDKIQQGGTPIPATRPEVVPAVTITNPLKLVVVDLHDAPFLLAQVQPRLHKAQEALAIMEAMEFDIEEDPPEDQQGEEETPGEEGE